MLCVLCGSNERIEWRPTELIRAQVRERYKAGPFAWQNLCKHTSVDVTICVHCLNHIRKRRKFKTRQMLPMDQYLLGMLNPAVSTKIDMRSQKRLNRVLNQGCNPFTCTGIHPLKLILESQCPVQTWWKLNLYTNFFNDGNTARLVRHNIRTWAM